MRLVRRASARDVRSVPVTRNTLVTWGERGFLREGDRIADPLRGTLTLVEVPEVAQAVSKSRWRTAANVAVATALAGGAGLALTAGPVGVAASVPLLAAFQVWTRAKFARPEPRLESLPADAAGCDRLEHGAFRRELRSAVRKCAGLMAIATAVAVPVAVPARLALGAAAAFGARRWFGRRP